MLPRTVLNAHSKLVSSSLELDGYLKVKRLYAFGLES